MGNVKFTVGLFESIGWKTGEYVAAAKAIVNEKLRYQVPGNFLEGINYLGFESAEQCVNAVKKLLNDPQAIYKMKCSNQSYYVNYLRPDVLVENSLKIVDNYR